MSGINRRLPDYVVRVGAGNRSANDYMLEVGAAWNATGGFISVRLKPGIAIMGDADILLVPFERTARGAEAFADAAGRRMAANDNAAGERDAYAE